MEKQEALRRWIGLEPDQPVMPHFTPIAADAKGSTFGACGIRISGNPAFVDAVLSRLKDLLEAESGSTRLVLSRQPVKPVSIQKGGGKAVDKHWDNAADDAEVCYVQIREGAPATARPWSGLPSCRSRKASPSRHPAGQSSRSRRAICSRPQRRSRTSPAAGGRPPRPTTNRLKSRTSGLATARCFGMMKMTVKRSEERRPSHHVPVPMHGTLLRGVSHRARVSVVGSGVPCCGNRHRTKIRAVRPRNSANKNLEESSKPH